MYSHLGECDRLAGQTPELLLSLQLFATAVLVNADQTCKHKPAALTLIPNTHINPLVLLFW